MRIKDNQYRNSDEHGSYIVCFGQRTIEVKFIGFLSEQLIEKYCHDLSLMLKVIEWQCWGYYGDLTECDPKSSITRDVLVKLYQRFLNHGCIVEAYTIDNPLAINNIIDLRKAAGIEHATLEKNLFTDRKQAINFIQSYIDNASNKVAK